MSVPVAPSGGRLTLSTPDALVASIPHMLGFPPADSVVIVGIASDGVGESSMVRLTQRFDRPPTGGTDEAMRELARQAAAPMIRSGSTEVVITVFGDSVAGLDPVLPDAVLVDELVTAFDDGGVRTKDTIFTDGASRWSYGCMDPQCCPPSGRVIPEDVRTLVAAEFAGAGAAMVTSRESLVSEVAPADAAALAEVAELAATAQAHRASLGNARKGGATRNEALEAWREASLATITSIISREPTTPSVLAHAAVGLGDIRVRDTVLWELTQPGADTHGAISGLTAVVRHAPPGHVAPAATALGICHWTSGDGARATTALNRAVADNPEYSLASLVGMSIQSGLPPQSWREAMAGLSRESCRHGNTPRPAPRAAAAPRRPAPIAAPSPGIAL
jgi:hypothetical protein